MDSGVVTVSLPASAPWSRRPRRAAVLVALVGAFVLGQAAPASPVSADHGGREIGSLLACDRPVTPPRCTSVGNNLRHLRRVRLVAARPTLPSRCATRWPRTTTSRPLPDDRAAQPVTPLTDVVAFSGDYGDNGAAGWVYCPADAPRGINRSGDRWCKQQELHLNLNPRYTIFFDDDPSRDHVACHELGHTVGLLHWGNPPESDGPGRRDVHELEHPERPDVAPPERHRSHQRLRLLVCTCSSTRSAADRVAHRSRGHSVASHDGLRRRLIEATGLDRPASLAELVGLSDAVVVGHVTAVERGRIFGPRERAAPLRVGAGCGRADPVRRPRQQRSRLPHSRGPALGWPGVHRAAARRRWTTPIASFSCEARPPPRKPPGWTLAPMPGATVSSRSAPRSSMSMAAPSCLPTTMTRSRRSSAVSSRHRHRGAGIVNAPFGTRPAPGRRPTISIAISAPAATSRTSR